MTDLPRREFLALGGALLLARASADDAKSPAKLVPPPLPKALPREWLEATTLPLWPNDPPGAGTLTPCHCKTHSELCV